MRSLVPAITVGLLFPILIVTQDACAEAFSVTVPGRSWRMSFDLPALAEFQGQVDGDRFNFIGHTVDGGWTISFFLEPWSNGGSSECGKTYWAQGSKGPLVKQESVKVADRGRYYMASYLLEGDFKGEYLKSASANFYFVHKGSCVDVHVSKYPYVLGDEQVVSAVGESLKWAEEPK